MKVIQKIEGDEGAADELNVLDNTVTSDSRHVSVEQDIYGDEHDSESFVLPAVASSDTLDGESEEEWNGDCSYFYNVKNNFETRMEGKPKFLCSANDRELTYFSKFFDDDAFTLIVNETNLYAKQNRGSRCPSKTWVDTTTQEMRAYIGCLILMGIHQLPTLSNFWSSDPILKVEPIANVMTSKRLTKIVENVHCNNNETAKPRNYPEYDKMHKLQPLIEKLLQSCENNYEPS
ncbi:piggyBac transposable element-derived protein 5-like [Schistocerca piceifrons]|uniref:piggyBac transposable element-derived protein 5-like n=1 Tax=Schistocerca piceifrons TaxID=274613 RepID=UPI001F5E68D5|nr:piggyBac transposable element-derived protein 5-like [Schistocerca piceifrons]